MGGLGKTSLAAALAADPRTDPLFPDGTFWVDLRASDPMSTLDRIGASLGFDLSPFNDLDSRTKSARSALHAKRALLILDDAIDADELAPLLIAQPGSAILITTRNAGLAASVADHVCALAPLSDADSAALLARIANKPPADTDLPARARIASRLGGLPLALALVGRRARQTAAKPWFSWDSLADELEHEDTRLDLSLHDRSVRASFNLTYDKSLDDTQRARFALLGIFEPGEIDLPCIAAAWNTDAPAAAAGMEDLTDVSLIDRVGKLTYRLHPLLRDFAREKLNDIPAADTTAAHQRACDTLLERAEREWKKPRSAADLRDLFSAIYHAHTAKDRGRFYTAFPWFPPIRNQQAHPDHTPIPGFLIQHGQLSKLIDLQKLDVDFTKASPTWARSWSVFRLGDYLCNAGRAAEGIATLEESIAIIDADPDLVADNDSYAMAFTKFAYRLGQAILDGNDATQFPRALALFTRCAQLDEKGNHFPQLALAACHAGDAALRLGETASAITMYLKGREAAITGNSPREHVIACIRLARADDPSKAESWLEEALAYTNEPARSPFTGVEGARLLTQIAQAYLNVPQPTTDAAPPDPGTPAPAPPHHPPLRMSLHCFGGALSLLTSGDSPYQEVVTLTAIASLCCNLRRASDGRAEYPAAKACLELIRALVADMNPPPLDVARLELTVEEERTPEGAARADAAGPDLRQFVLAELTRLEQLVP
jgi:tetratricopeptide (TPR) repeat protein